MKDVTGKMISGIDETIVPYDSRDPAGKVFDISGAELHPLLVQLAGKTTNLTFILDSCHSGTLVRGARVRSIPMDTRTPPPVSGTREVTSTPAEATPKFAFLLFVQRQPRMKAPLSIRQMGPITARSHTSWYSSCALPKPELPTKTSWMW
jgi:hypothetical protein